MAGVYAKAQYSFDVKPTFHSQSAPGYIDHLKITGGMGTFQAESKKRSNWLSGGSLQ